MVLPETPAMGAVAFAERLRERLEAQLFAVNTPTPVRLTTSIGVASFPGPRIETVDDLFARADEALYRAKADGRNRVRA